MITTIILDFVGVLVKENDFPLSDVQKKLEAKFGKRGLNSVEQYFAWAIKETGLSKEELDQELRTICENIYTLRDDSLFNQFQHYRLGLATNHLPYVYDWLVKNKLKQKFSFILTSSDCNMEKPDKVFFSKLIKVSGEVSQNILFVDDDINNIEAARQSGIHALHYHKQDDLCQSIHDAINSINQGTQDKSLV